jgi:hypothetical protein
MHYGVIIVVTPLVHSYYILRPVRDCEILNCRLVTQHVVHFVNALEYIN